MPSHSGDTPGTSRAQARDAVTTIITWLGAAILILGVIFLAVQAVEQAWLGPSVAVILVAILCLCLMGYSLLAHHRSPNGPVAPALLTVGILGLLCDIWATVFGLEWIDSWLGATLIAVTCAIGLGIARWWDQLWLAFTLLLLGGFFVAPATFWFAVDHRETPVASGCLLALGVLGWASTWRRNWIPVDTAAALVFLCGVSLGAGEDLTLLVTIAAFCAIAMITVIGLSPTATTSAAASTAATITRWLPSSFLPVAFLLSDGGSGDASDAMIARGCALSIAIVTCAIPISRQLVAGETLATIRRNPQPTIPRNMGHMVRLGGSAPTAYGYWAPPSLPPLPPPAPATIADTMRAALGTGLAALAITFAENYFHSDWTWWLCALIAVSGLLIWFSRLLPPAFPWVFGGYTVILGVPLLIPAWVHDAEVYSQPLWLTAALYLVLGVLMLLRADTLRLTLVGKVIAGGALLLLGTSSIPLIARGISDSDLSFMTGHLLVSVLWMLLGVFFLLRSDARIGLGLAVVTTAKLVFYDLAALDGLIQVAAFILCGLILLSCAVARDRMRRSPSDATGEAPSSDTPTGEALTEQPLT